MGTTRRPTAPKLARGQTPAARQLEQLDALRVIVTAAAKANLPAITWRLSDLGTTLIGETFTTVYTSADKHDYPATRAARRAAFDAYARLIETYTEASITRYGHHSHEYMRTKFTRWPEHERAGGVRHLHAVAERVRIPLGAGRRSEHERAAYLVLIAVMADLHPDLDPDLDPEPDTDR